MPLALIIALAGSLAIHTAALFGTDVELFGGGPEPAPLRAELRAPPTPPEPPGEVGETPRPAAKPPVKAVPHKAKRPPVLVSAKAAPIALPPDAPAENAAPEANPAAPPASEPAVVAPPTPRPPAKPVLPARGTIRFAIFKESLGMQVGRAEHRWEFAEDGHYRLVGITETSGLAALFKPVRLEVESVGVMVAGGLQPARYRTLKSGKATNENADFDWSSAVVHLERDGSVREIAKGTQDLLSLNYQLAYLGKLAEGSTIGVVTGKKYERYALDSLGEEDLETPAGRFRTLHLRAMTDNVTEIWIALDRQRLPVKIRFTDKKGESFEQVVTELGGEAGTSR